MFPRKLVAAFVAVLAAPSLVAAQNPNLPCDLKKQDWSCAPNPALGTSVTCDFTKGKCDDFLQIGGTKVKYGEDGAMFESTALRDSPTIITNKFVFFGRVEAEIRCAPGAGIVTAATFLSHVGDEIDFEWIGSEKGRVQSNYFGKDNTTTYDRGDTHVVSTPTSEFHKYGIEWTKDWIKWSIDGTVVRTLNSRDAYRDDKGRSLFPQTPMQIKLGVWTPVISGSQKWAGGKQDFSKGPFVAYVKSIKIEDYAGGDKPVSGGVKEYAWSKDFISGEKSGSWQGIQIVKGEGGGPIINAEAGSNTASKKQTDSTTATSSAATSTSKAWSSSGKENFRPANATASLTSFTAITTAMSQSSATPQSVPGWTVFISVGLTASFGALLHF